MLKFWFAGCLGLSLAVSAQFTLKMGVYSLKSQKFTKFFCFGGSKSFKVINVDKSKKPVTGVCYDITATVITVDEPIAAK